MLASQFLNVVLEDRSESESDNEDKNNNLMRTLQLNTRLPKVFIEECTIELNIPGEKKPPKELSFEACVSPIYTNTSSYSRNDNGYDEQECLVEAVYSGEESDGESSEFGSAQCKLCGREFFRNCSLAIHLKSHECVGPLDARPFKCETCGKSYAQKSVLKKHMAVHSGEKLQCDLCSVGFTQRSSLVRHRKRMHPELFEET